jgi:hypothetical protein
VEVAVLARVFDEERPGIAVDAEFGGGDAGRGEEQLRMLVFLPFLLVLDERLFYRGGRLGRAFFAVPLGVGANGGEVGAERGQLADEHLPVLAECSPDDFPGVVEVVAGCGFGAVDGVAAMAPAPTATSIVRKSVMTTPSAGCRPAFRM